MYLLMIYSQNKTDIIKRYINYLMFFARCIVTPSLNTNQRNAHFSNQCFNLIFDIFCILRTSRLHNQKDSFYRQFLYVCRWNGVFEHNLPPARCLHKCKKIITYENCVYSLSGDKHVMLETGRTYQKLN
jgi:hypothetical protein